MAFTKGTEQEVAFLVEALALEPGMRVLDVGCGPGRHSLALARRGIAVVGVDHSPEFVDSPGTRRRPRVCAAEFAALDVRDLGRTTPSSTPRSACARAGSACSAAGTSPTCSAGSPPRVRPGGRLALSAFSATFAVRFLEAGENFDPATGVLHEHATVRDPDGGEAPFDLWTTCFTAARARAARGAARGLTSTASTACTPGDYAPTRRRRSTHPELLLPGRAVSRHPTRFA